MSLEYDAYRDYIERRRRHAAEAEIASREPRPSLPVRILVWIIGGSGSDQFFFMPMIVFMMAVFALIPLAAVVYIVGGTAFLLQELRQDGRSIARARSHG